MGRNEAGPVNRHVNEPASPTKAPAGIPDPQPSTAHQLHAALTRPTTSVTLRRDQPRMSFTIITNPSSKPANRQPHIQRPTGDNPAAGRPGTAPASLPSSTARRPIPAAPAPTEPLNANKPRENQPPSRPPDTTPPGGPVNPRHAPPYRRRAPHICDTPEGSKISTYK